MWVNYQKLNFWMVFAIVLSLQQTADPSSLISVNFTVSSKWMIIPTVHILGFCLPIFIHASFLKTHQQYIRCNNFPEALLPYKHGLRCFPHILCYLEDHQNTQKSSPTPSFLCISRVSTWKTEESFCRGPKAN